MLCRVLLPASGCHNPHPRSGPTQWTPRPPAREQGSWRICLRRIQYLTFGLLTSREHDARVFHGVRVYEHVCPRTPAVIWFPFFWRLPGMIPPSRQDTNLCGTGKIQSKLTVESGKQEIQLDFLLKIREFENFQSNIMNSNWNFTSF